MGLLDALSTDEAKLGLGLLAAGGYSPTPMSTGQRLQMAMQGVSADKQNALILTTVKDHVRLPNSLKERVKKFRVHLEWKDPQGLSSLLTGILGNGG